MISLQPLFEDADISSVPKKYKKRISRKCKIFKGFEASLPELSYPEIDTKRFEADLDEVRRCVKDPSLSKKFLKLTDRNSEDVFKKFLKDEEVDWSSMSDVFKEFDGVMLRMKFKYDRKRPFEYFEDRGEDIEVEVAHSPSFPSGHVAFAYLLCDYFSDMFPEKSMQLQTLAEMISQSRIENGVHFPTDVTAGRFLGELAAKFILSKKDLSESFKSRENEKIFVRFLRKKACKTRRGFKKKEALEYFVNDIATFINECTGKDDSLCYEASKSLIEGYSLERCSKDEEIKRLIEGMLHIFFSRQEEFSDIAKLNQVTESKSELRKVDKITISGLTYSPVEKIKEYSTKVCKLNNKPFLKLATLSWIAPFSSGNRKITNLVFLKESNFNFDITNQIITDDLDYMLENFYREGRIKTILS